MIRHKWRQQRGFVSAGFKCRYLKLPPLRKGRRLRKRDQKGKPITGLLYFVTESHYCQFLFSRPAQPFQFNIFKPCDLRNLRSRAKCTCAYLLWEMGTRSVLCIGSARWIQVEGSSVLDGTAQFFYGPKFLWTELSENQRGKKVNWKKNIPKISHRDISQTLLNQFWDLAENVLSSRLIMFVTHKRR